MDNMNTVVKGTMNDTINETVPEVTKKFGFGKAAGVAVTVGLGVLIGKKIIKKIKAKKNAKNEQFKSNNQSPAIEDLKAKGYTAIDKEDYIIADGEVLLKPMGDLDEE